MLKPAGPHVDALVMTTRPERGETEPTGDSADTCQDCGRPIEAGAGESFRSCRSCYDVYVENAGR